MKASRVAALVLGTIAVFSFGSHAAAFDTHVFPVTLSGAFEFPPVATGGSGSCTVTLDDVTGAVSVSGSFTGLTSNATLAHIHGLSAPGANSGIIITLSETGGTSGTVSGGGILTPAQITGMLNGLTYVNIHTSSNGGGELRGQIMVGVPSMPLGYAAVLVVLALAGGAFVLARRGAPAG